MSRSATVILLGDDRWEITTMNAATPSPSESILVTSDFGDCATAVQEYLAARSCQDAPLALLLPATWCMTGTLDTPAASRPRSGLAGLAYRLEEKLPFAAEDVVADFIRSGETALGVAGSIEPLGAIVRSLESCGLVVDYIGPASLCALQELQREREADSFNMVAWRTAEGTQLFWLVDGVLTDWRCLPGGTRQELRRELRVRARPGAEPPRAIALGFEPALLDGLQLAVQLSHWGDQTMTEFAGRGAAAILSGARRPWINLRRGPLAASSRLHRVRKPLACAISAVLLLLACSASTLIWRARGYERLVARAEAEQRSLFAEAFANQPVPVQVLSRLRAEDRRLSASRDGGVAARDTDSSVPSQTVVFVALRDLLTAFPRDLRIQILELRLEQDKVYLEGLARSHGDAEVLASALRTRGGLELGPPRSEQRGEAEIWFTLSGTPAATQGIARSEP